MTRKPIDLAEYRKRRKKKKSWREHLFGAENPPGPGEVSCPKCKQPASGRASRCPHCGVHFSGFAADFAPKPHFLSKPWVRVVLLVLIIALIAAALQEWMGI